MPPAWPPQGPWASWRHFRVSLKCLQHASQRSWRHPALALARWLAGPSQHPGDTLDFFLKCLQHDPQGPWASWKHFRIFLECLQHASQGSWRHARGQAASVLARQSWSGWLAPASILEALYNFSKVLPAWPPGTLGILGIVSLRKGTNTTENTRFSKVDPAPSPPKNHRFSKVCPSPHRPGFPKQGLF